MMFRLYVKWPNQTRFSPVDWKQGKQVINLIYASIFTDEEKELVANELEKQRENNKGMEFKFQNIKEFTK